MLVSARLRRVTIAIIGLCVPFNGELLAALPLIFAALREWLGWIRTPLDVPLAAFAIWSLIATLVAHPPALPGFLAAAGLIYLVYQLPYRWFKADPGLIGVLGQWTCTALPVAVALGVLSYLYVPNPNLGSFRRFTLGQTLPGVFAYALEVAVLLSLAALSRFRRFTYLSVAVGIFGLIGTLSRWALLGLGSGLLVWAGGLVRQSPRTVAAVLATVALAGAITLSLPLTQAIIGQYVPEGATGNRWIDALKVGFGLQTGLPEHFSIWRGTMRMINDHRWFGVGYGTFAAIYPRYFDPADARITALEAPVYLAPTHAHNDILVIAAAAGFPAALAYGAFLLTALARSLIRLSPTTAPAAAVLVASVVHGLFDGITTTFVGPLVVFWVAVAAAIQVQQSRSSAPPSA